MPETKDLVAGIELDALVAEARGWINFTDRLGEPWPKDITSDKRYKNCFIIEDEFVFRYNEDHEFSIYNPSSSISYAWELVEEMKDSLWYCYLQNCGHPKYCWRVVFIHHEMPEQEAEAPTAQEAICRAYLSVKGVYETQG